MQCFIITPYSIENNPKINVSWQQADFPVSVCLANFPVSDLKANLCARATVEMQFAARHLSMVSFPYFHLLLTVMTSSSNDNF